MIQQLKHLDYLLEQINDEELKFLIIDTSMELLKELPEEVLTYLKDQLKDCDENSTDQSQYSFPEVL